MRFVGVREEEEEVEEEVEVRLPVGGILGLDDGVELGVVGVEEIRCSAVTVDSDSDIVVRGRGVGVSVALYVLSSRFSLGELLGVHVVAEAAIKRQLPRLRFTPRHGIEHTKAIRGIFRLYVYGAGHVRLHCVANLACSLCSRQHRKVRAFNILGTSRYSILLHWSQYPST
jgi:hypothetical protein